MIERSPMAGPDTAQKESNPDRARSADKASGGDSNGAGGARPASIDPAAKRAASQFVAQGNRSRDAKDWAGARANYEEAVRLNPTLQPIWIQLGHAAKESGDLFGAEGANRKALELDPSDADGHLQLGHLLKIRGHFAAALESYNQAMALDHRLTDAHIEVWALRARVGAEAIPPSFSGAAKPGSSLGKKPVP